MKFNILAMLGVLALCCTSVSANDVSNNITSTNGTTFFGALHTDNADFTDVFTFTVAGTVKANTSLITIGSGMNNIDFVSADLNGTALALSPNGFLETGSLGDTMFTGPLVLTVKGKSGAAGGIFASYSGTMNVVPEPSTCMLGLSALGACVAMARRRRS